MFILHSLFRLGEIFLRCKKRRKFSAFFVGREILPRDLWPLTKFSTIIQYFLISFFLLSLLLSFFFLSLNLSGSCIYSFVLSHSLLLTNAKFTKVIKHTFSSTKSKPDKMHFSIRSMKFMYV